MEVFLTFTDRRLEERWCRHHNLGLVRTIEVVASILCLTFTTSVFVVSASTGSVRWELLVFCTVQYVETGTAMIMGTFFKETWHEVRDGLAMLFRVVLTPLSHHLLRSCLHNVLNVDHPVGMMIALIFVFGGAATVKDSFVLPLKFRQHLITQVIVAIEWGLYNWKFCDSCCSLEWQKPMIQSLCSAMALMSTGIMIDCGEAGFQRACMSAGFQIPTLFGLVGPSFFIYRLEQASRVAFLNRQGSHREEGPSTSSQQGFLGSSSLYSSEG